MVYIEKEIFNFYNYKTVFYNSLTDKEVVNYTDEPSSIERMVAKHDHMKNLQIIPLEPTVEQYERLKEFNSLILDIKNNYINDCSLYVEHGAVFNKDKALNSIFEKSKEATKKFIMKVLKPSFKKLRTEKELSGFIHNGKWFDSDADGRLALTSAMGLVNIQISAGTPAETILNEKIVWKMKDNKHFECTYKELQEVCVLIGKMVADAFKTEGKMEQALSKYSIEELLTLKELEDIRIFSKSVSDKTLDLKEVFEQTFKEVQNGK